MARTDIDLMEYANDEAAQAAFVSNADYGADVCTGGTASADAIFNATYSADKAFDNNTGTSWVTNDTVFPHWLKYDLGAGVTKTVKKLRIMPTSDGGHSTVNAFKLQGSNDNSIWIDVYSGNCADTPDTWQDFTFINSIAYRYYRIYITSSYVGTNYCRVTEVEMLEGGDLRDFSEGTIKTEGSYALKGIGKAVDGYDSYTKLLLHCEGADASTIVKDEKGNMVSMVGTAQLDTAQYKFGAASLLLDGNSDYVTVPDSDDWYFGTADFTIDFWVRFNTLTNQQCLFSQQVDNNNRWFLIKRSSGASNLLEFVFVSGGVTKANYLQQSWSPNSGQWYHIEICRSGTTAKLFIDGVQSAMTENTAFGTNDVGNIGAILQIGYSTSITACYLDGWIDEFRVSKGIARHTSNFTAPTSAYAVDTGGSNGKTLTRTVSPTISLSGLDYIGIYVRSSRTGANIKIGFHDSGGTTTEFTITINAADTWELKVLDLSAVTNANKDVIDSITITVTNADADNTFYIDCIYADIFASYLNRVRRGRVLGNISGI